MIGGTLTETATWPFDVENMQRAACGDAKESRGVRS